jgi:glycosyltransferase involved in cell wall biosynthesis
LLLHNLHVLLLMSTYQGSGGHESVINNLAKGLMKLGHEVVIGAFSFKKNPPDLIPTLHLSRFRNILFSSSNFDIIHCHHTRMNYFSLVNSKPFLFHYHGTSSIIQQVNLKSSMFLCKSSISKIIAVSNFALSQIQRVGGSSALKIPSEVICNGVDTQFYNINLPDPYRSGDPQLLFVGNLYRYKMVPRILEEIPDMLKSFPNLHLQIVGDGEDSEHIRKEIMKRNLSKHVQLIGELEGEDLRLRYASSDVYVSASTKETVGLPLLESMACGKPVIVSNIGAHSEVIRASKAGLEFSIAEKHGIRNALTQILEDKNRYAMAALDFARKNDWSKACARISEIYHELIVTPNK